MVGRGVGAEAQVEGTGGRGEVAGRPVVPVGLAPPLAVDEDAVAVRGRRSEALDPHVVGVVGGLAGHDGPVAVEHLDRGPTDRDRPDPERLARAPRPPRAAVLLEDEPAPGDQGGRGRDVDELYVRLEQRGHRSGG